MATTYKFERAGSYVVISEEDASGIRSRALPCGKFSVALDAALDGRICIVEGVKSRSEVSNSVYELSFFYTQIALPSCTSANDAVQKLSEIFSFEGNEAEKSTLGTSEMLSAYELGSLSALQSINSKLQDIVFLLKSIAR